MQMDKRSFVRPGKPVFDIPSDGTPDPRQLNPDLVVPAGLKFDLKKEIAIAGSDQPVIEDCFFGAGRG
jgi:hypothetical protein